MLTTGKIAKPGVMVYQLADGSKIRELVEPDVLQDEGSNATLFSKAFTLEHPTDDVTPDNWAALAHGVTGPPSYQDDHDDGPGLYCPFTVHTRKMLDVLESEDGPRELSPGYTVKVDDTPGEHPEYGPYDSKQVPGSRRYNHVALTEAARGGPDLTIRKDSAIEVTPMALKKQPAAPKKKTDATDADDLQNLEEESEPEDKMDAFMSEMRDAMKSLNDRMSALEDAKKDATEEGAEDADADAEGGEPPAPKQDTKKTKKSDSHDDRLKWFQARRDLEDLAARFQVKAGTMDDNALKLAIVQAARPGTSRKDSAYIDATLDLIRDGMVGSPAKTYRGLGPSLMGESSTRQDTAQDSEDPTDLFFKGAAGRK